MSQGREKAIIHGELITANLRQEDIKIPPGHKRAAEIMCVRGVISLIMGSDQPPGTLVGLRADLARINFSNGERCLQQVALSELIASGILAENEKKQLVYCPPQVPETASAS